MRPIERAHYVSGFRAGHFYGRERAGSFVVGEEYDLSEDACEGRTFANRFERTCFAGGYSDGYRCGAEGAAIPETIEHKPRVKLSTGLVVVHYASPSGCTDVVTLGGRDMSSDEWNEYADIISGRRVVSP